MFCIKCGTEILDDSLYCINCGEKINRSIQQPTEPPTSVNNTQKTKINKNSTTYIRKKLKIFGVLSICCSIISIILKALLSLNANIDLAILFAFLVFLSGFFLVKFIHSVIDIPRKERTKPEKVLAIFCYIFALIGIIYLILDKIELFKEIFC